jgi:hypothetical protein
MFEGNKCYFETKRKSADTRQKIPQTLETELTKLGKEVSFTVTPQLRKRNYDCTGLSDLIHDIKAYLVDPPRDDRDVPLPFYNDILELYFDVDGDTKTWMEYEHPDSPEDIEKHTLGPRDGKVTLNNDGEPMIPMVEQCRRKGADYLMCQVGFVESAARLAEACLPDVTRLSPREYETSDSRLSGLKGIVFFRTTFDWCIVRNGSQP